MKHIYKQGGAHKAGDMSYTIRSVANKDIQHFLDRGWALSLDTMPIEAEFKVVEKQPELSEDEQKEILMNELDKYGIHANSRWGLKTLQEKLSEMQNGNDNQG